MKNRLIVLLLAGTILSGCGGDDLPDPPADIRISGIELSETSKTLKISESFTLKAEVKPANTTDDKTVSWASSDASVATVNNRIITAIGLGEAVITAQAGTITATCKVTVIPVDVAGIVLSEIEKEIQAGDNFTLTATIEPANATNKNVVWSTSDKAIATVENGSVTGISIGEAIITAKSTSGNISASCKVKVVPTPVAGVSFKDNEISIIEGRTHLAQYVIVPGNATNKNVTFKSHDTAIFEVDDTGLITGISEGTSKLTVISEDGIFDATIGVTVRSFVEELIIGMQFGNYSNPGGYITMTGSIRLSNYSAKSIFVDQFMILDAAGLVVTGSGVGNTLNPDQMISIPVSFSNVYRAKAVFTVTVNGKEYVLQKSL